MANSAVRQHWVPKVYLRAFCAKPVTREQIHVMDIKDGTRFITSIDRVAVQKHLYTLDLNTSAPSFVIEEAFSRLETEVHDVLLETIRESVLPINTYERLILARFVGTQLMRTRQGLQLVSAHREEVREQMIRDGEHYPKAEYERLLALTQEGMREHFAQSAVLVGNALARHILGMQWSLIRATEGHFLTCENPVICYHPTETNWGIGSSGGVTLFPLSPNLLLHLSNEQTLPVKALHDVSLQGVRSINRLIILAAKQFVYSHVAIDYPSDLIAGR